jgi:hypothetical protein
MKVTIFDRLFIIATDVVVLLFCVGTLATVRRPGAVCVFLLVSGVSLVNLFHDIRDIAKEGK